jgi:starch synthase (maltosyl-transferring)
MPVKEPRQAPARIQIEHPAPTVDGGRWPVKRTVGDVVDVAADIFRDGHEVLRAEVRWRAPGERRWRCAPLRAVDAHVNGVHWEGSLALDGPPGRWSWTIRAWTDPFAAWRDEVARKLEAGQEDLLGEASEGVVLLRAAAERASGAAARRIAAAADALEETADVPQALDAELAGLVDGHPDQGECAELPRPLEIDVDRERGRFGSWYELFPRSWGGLRGTADHVPRLAELGFDVLYLPPVHPIGHTNRKGRNNALVAGPADPGSPYAIGDETGGHTALHPDLGTWEDFDHLVATLHEHGMELCLDFAIQASADHPWLAEHPEWFNRRPDGSLKYAENPPKKYQDIYNFNFDSEDWQGLWQAWLDVVLFWVGRGVRIFRVDNPHTKPLPFWEWLIAEVRKEHPDVLFLAEAFTRRSVMRALAKLGFSQSYTYFTWKNGRWELMEYVVELATTQEREYFRPNFFVNTPDILSGYLAHGGPPAFAVRLVLAATLAPSYGVYSGFESFEHTPVRPGSEEYLDSEKYEIRERRLDGPLLPLIARLNQARRDNPALQRLENIRFLDAHNDAIMAFAKRAGANLVITVVNLDPGGIQEGLVDVPWDLGVPPAFTVTDLLDVARYDWRLGGNYVRLSPHERCGHVLRVDTP